MYTNAVEAGNKLIANTGTVRMHGTERTTMTRLLASANPGDTELNIDAPSDWAVGDWIMLAPTYTDYKAADYV